MVRVKICGITSVEDGLLAARAGADAIGLVFAESPRRVTPEKAAEIVAALPPFTAAVGLFADQAAEQVRRICREAEIRIVQLHGSETPDYIRGLRDYKVIKAIRVGTRRDLEALNAYRVDAFLLDARIEGKLGGTGQTFDWSLAKGLKTVTPIILAGGLNPGNVAEAVQTVRPYGVDVSSGVEKAPGRKDPDLVRRFIMAAKRAGARRLATPAE